MLSVADKKIPVIEFRSVDGGAVLLTPTTLTDPFQSLQNDWDFSAECDLLLDAGRFPADSAEAVRARNCTTLQRQAQMERT